MAFATSNVRTGVIGDMKVTYGDWSGASADGSGTVAVSGGRVYLAEFRDADGSGPFEVKVLTGSDSVSGSTVTVTEFNKAEVTTGRFIIIHK